MANGREEEEDDLWRGIAPLSLSHAGHEPALGLPTPAAQSGAQNGPHSGAHSHGMTSQWAQAIGGPALARMRAAAQRLAPRALTSVFGGIMAPAQALQAARRDLMLWLPIWLSVGIGLWFAARAEPTAEHYWTVAGVGLASLAFCSLRARDAQFVWLAFAALCVGFLLTGWRAHQVAAPALQFRYYGAVEGRIVAADRSGSDKIRLTLDQLRIDRIAPENTPERVRISLQEPPGEGAQAWLSPEPGQRVMLTAHLMPYNGPAQPEGYDFRRHAWFERIGAVGYTRTPVLLAAPPDAQDWPMAAHRFRMSISRAIQELHPDQAGAMAAALLVGDRAGITSATNEVMRASNLFHIIAISGLHMGMLTGFVFAALNAAIALIPWLSLRVSGRKVAAFGGIVAGTIYLWISGGSVATERAFVMTTVMLLAVLLDRRALSLRTVAMAACLILIFTPEALVSPGFQMSFGATVALIVMAGPWSRRARKLPPILRPVLLLIATSFIAGLVTAPIAAVHFNRMAEYGVLANLFAVPVMGTIVMPAGVIAAVLAPVGLAAPALWVMTKGTAWIIFVAQTVAGFEGAVTAIPTPAGWVLPVMTMGALMCILARGFARSCGVAALAVAFFACSQVTVNAVLIASEGELVGVMTPQGRALSKNGAQFVATSWLDADGDASPVDLAAARDGFTGPNSARSIRWRGHEIVHLTGKSAPERLAEICTRGRIVVIKARIAREDRAGDCLLVDQNLLRETGSIALNPLRGDAESGEGDARQTGPAMPPRDGGDRSETSDAAQFAEHARRAGFSVTTAKDAVGARLWTGQSN